MKSGEELKVETPSEFPDHALIAECLEPLVRANIITPADTMGSVIKLCQDREGSSIPPPSPFLLFFYFFIFLFLVFYLLFLFFIYYFYLIN